MAAHTGSFNESPSRAVSGGTRRHFFSRASAQPVPKYVTVRLSDFPRGSLMYILRRAIFKFTSNGGTDLAASLTYFTVLSVFPALLAVVSLLGVFGQSKDSATALLAFLQENVPTQMYGILEDPIRQITSGHGAGLALITGILSALWSASGYTASFGRALNRVYGVREGRPGWLLRASNISVTGILIILVTLMVLMLLLGGTVLDLIGQYVPLTIDMDLVKVVWLNGRWVLILLMAIGLITLLYAATPNVRRYRAWRLSAGATVALLGMGLGAFGFTFYADNISKYNATYGLIGGVIVMLLFIWILNNMLLFGAHLDAEIMLMRQIIAGDDDHGYLRVQPRSVSAIRTRKARSEVLLATGRQLQQRSAGQDMLPELKKPSVMQRMQKVMDTNTTMIRTMIADGKEYLDSAGEQVQERRASSTTGATETQNTELNTAQAAAPAKTAQKALFDLDTDNPPKSNSGDPKN